MFSPVKSLVAAKWRRGMGFMMSAFSRAAMVCISLLRTERVVVEMDLTDVLKYDLCFEELELELRVESSLWRFSSHDLMSSRVVRSCERDL